MQMDLAEAGSDLEGISQTLRSRVCIVGGGIAGLTLARSLTMDGVDVILLEAGGSRQERSTVDDESDPFGAQLRGRLHDGTRVGRVRALGGCSLTWGGQLLPLPDDSDWPVSAQEIAAYQYGVPLPDEAEALRERARPPLLEQMPELTFRLSRFVPFSRRNLARMFGPKLARSPQVHLVLHATATELILCPAGNRVVGVSVRTPDGRALRVAADQFVVAAGTVETCRLLLASRSVTADGVGNAYGQVGRNFHDHLTLPAAAVTGQTRQRMLAELGPWVFTSKGQGRAVYSIKLEPSASLRRELGLNRSMAHLTVEEPANSGVEALRRLLQARQSGGSRAVIGQSLAQMPAAAGMAARLAWEARVHQRRYVSAAGHVRLQLNMAQDAPSASRLLLSTEMDRFGMRRAVVDWRVSGPEMDSLRRFAAYLRERLAATGLAGGLVWQEGLFSPGPEGDAALCSALDDARHAMGGACMGVDPRTSVVDPELRVHGVANLSVVSPAVFPDGSAQLPTLTLTALCLRLADRLRTELV